MNTLDVLVKARALIEKPENWTTGAYVRNAGGSELDTLLHEDAARYCASGAITRALYEGGDFDIEYEDSVCDIVARAMEGDSIPAFNDSHTHAEVLAAFDKAIEAERAKLEAV